MVHLESVVVSQARYSSSKIVFADKLHEQESLDSKKQSIQSGSRLCDRKGLSIARLGQKVDSILLLPSLLLSLSVHDLNRRQGRFVCLLSAVCASLVWPPFRHWQIDQVLTGRQKKGKDLSLGQSLLLSYHSGATLCQAKKMDELVCAPMLSLVRSLGALFAFKLKDPLIAKNANTEGRKPQQKDWVRLACVKHIAFHPDFLSPSQFLF